MEKKRTTAAKTGERVAQIRAMLNLNQEDMAARIGASFSSYRAYEAGQRLMRGDHLFRLVELGFNANWLLAGIGPMRVESHAGVCVVQDQDGVITERLDLEPVALAPALKWISSQARPEYDDDWWIKAADAVIARYELEFYTWLNAGKPAKWPSEG
jgi:transcriptional regulator with XRE-family HTH domain